MSKSNEISQDKNFSKNILSAELNPFKTKSKSPSLATSADSPKSSTYKNIKRQRKSSDFDIPSKIVLPLADDKNELFTIKTKSIEPPFISGFKENIFSIQNYNETIKADSIFNSDINSNSNSFVKIRGKITVNNNKITNFTEADIKTNLFRGNNNIFTNTFIDNDIYDTFLNSISKSSSNSNSPLNAKQSEENKDKDKDKEDIKKEEKENIEIKDTNNPGNNFDNLEVKEKIIIEALTEVNKSNFRDKEDDLDVYEFDLEDYYFNKKYKNIITSYSSEEDLEFEKNVYEFIDNRIKLYYKSFKNTKPHELEEKKTDIKKFSNEIKKILMYEKKVPNYKCLGFKSIIMSLFSLIIDLLSNSRFLIPFHKKHHENLPFDSDSNLLIFIDLYTKYNKIKEIFPYLEKDFKELIQNFLDEVNMQISLSDIFTDLFWDHVFKNRNINHKFTNVYISNNIKKNLSYEKSKSTMDKIIDILINCEQPYKKIIGQMLHLPYMNRESLFLMVNIIDNKKKYNYVIEDNKDDTLEKKEVDTNSNTNINENNNNIIIENNNNEISNNINNNKSQKKENNKNTDNFSLEEMYNYIQSDENSQKNKKKSKKHKKKKKKNNEKENEEEIVENDPVVEEFIQYFNDFNEKNTGCVKIKPRISQEWIESIL